MELREGMYIRSKDKRGNQFVRRIVELPTVPAYGSIVVDKNIHNVKWVSKKNVLKASNSIIDLIEVGDYVLANGYDTFLKVKCIDDCEGPIRQLYFDEDAQDIGIYNSDIRKIITKEQMSSMEYEVE